MRQADPRRAFFSTGWSSRCRAAQLVALFAVFLGQVMLPAALVGGNHNFAFIPSAAAAAAQSPIPHSHAEDPGGRDGRDAAHLICHFCRPDGVQLPPPPLSALEPLELSATPVRAPADRSFRPQEHFSTGHLTRAPPALS